MYEKFYGLRQRPFTLTPNPDFLYLSHVHQEALAHLRLGVESQAGDLRHREPSFVADFCCITPCDGLD